MTRTPLLVLLLVLTSPAATAADINLTIEARESDCPGDRTYCFVVAEGDLADLASPATVQLTFRNAGDLQHNLLVAQLGNAEVGDDTFASAAFFQTDAIDPGNETVGNFVIPAEAGGLYLWCDIAGHEQLGMWLGQDFGEEDNGAPLLLWPALVAVMVAAWLARR